MKIKKIQLVLPVDIAPTPKPEMVEVKQEINVEQASTHSDEGTVHFILSTHSELI